MGLVLRTDGKAAYIDIIDKGKGIDKVFAKNVFERLFTMEDSRNRNIQGNGLGLDSTPDVNTIFTVHLKKISY